MMTTLLNRQAIHEYIHADLYSDGLLEVSINDIVLTSQIGVFGEESARSALVQMLGQVGRVVEIDQAS